MNRTMRHRLVFTFQLTALGMLLAACAANDPMGTSLPEIPNRISIVPVERDLTIYFGETALSPSTSERARLLTFLRDADARPGDHLDIQAGPGPIGAARQASIARILGTLGLSDVATTSGRPGSGIVVVLRQRVAAPPAGCAVWPPLGAGDVLNAPSAHLGCATANNLYDMVVDKRDLAAGRTPGPANADPAIDAVKKYREGMASSAPNNAATAPPASVESSSRNATVSAPSTGSNPP